MPASTRENLHAQTCTKATNAPLIARIHPGRRRNPNANNKAHSLSPASVPGEPPIRARRRHDLTDAEVVLGLVLLSTTRHRSAGDAREEIGEREERGEGRKGERERERARGGDCPIIQGPDAFKTHYFRRLIIRYLYVRGSLPTSHLLPFRLSLLKTRFSS